MLSKLSIYSLGTVVKDKEKDSHIVYAIPYEVLTDLDGNLQNATQKVSGTLTEDAGKVFSSTTKRVALRCEWLPFGDLRTTSPDMVLGEQVIIYRYADTQDYYWTPKRQDLMNRKLEHIVLTLSNTKEDQEEKTAPFKKVYTITLSTRDGYLSIVTNDNQKEKAVYEVLLNTKDGIFKLSDNKENALVLNSVERTFRVKAGEITFECDSFINLGTFTQHKWSKLLSTLEVIKGTTLQSTLSVVKGGSFQSNLSVATTGSFGGGISSGAVISAGGFSAPNGAWHRP